MVQSGLFCCGCSGSFVDGWLGCCGAGLSVFQGGSRQVGIAVTGGDNAIRERAVVFDEVVLHARDVIQCENCRPIDIAIAHRGHDIGILAAFLQRCPVLHVIKRETPWIVIYQLDGVGDNCGPVKVELKGSVFSLNLIEQNLVAGCAIAQVCEFRVMIVVRQGQTSGLELCTFLIE
jgi:hypothetical protein